MAARVRTAGPWVCFIRASLRILPGRARHAEDAGFPQLQPRGRLSSLKHSSRCWACLQITKVHLRNNSHFEVSRGNQPKTHPLVICLKNCVIESVSGCLFLTSMENSWKIPRESVHMYQFNLTKVGGCYLGFQWEYTEVSTASQC